MTAVQIRIAKEAETADLQKIWYACFDDSADYVDFFFRRRPPDCLTVTAEKNGAAVGAAYLLPASVRDGGALRRAFYLYALGVLPDFRGLGIASEMMRRSFAFAEEEDAVLFLSPASPDLAAYYARLGMTPTYRAKWHRCEAAPQPVSDLPLTPIGAEEYFAYRKQTPVSGAVEWDADAVRYAVAENEFCGGFCLRLGESVFLGRREGNTLRITDSGCSAYAELLPALCRHLNAAAALYRQPADPTEDGAFVLGMTYNMHVPHNAPLGLLLD